MGTPAEEVFEATRRLYRALGRGEKPREFPTDLRLRRNETCYGDTKFDYARFYGLEVTVENRHYVGLSRQATEEIMLRWRSGESPVRVVLTSQRLLCAVDDEWLDFAFDTITGIDAIDMPNWNFVIRFQTAFPMRLYGAYAPAYALVIGHACWGVEFLKRPEFGLFA